MIEIKGMNIIEVCKDGTVTWDCSITAGSEDEAIEFIKHLKENGFSVELN